MDFAQCFVASPVALAHYKCGRVIWLAKSSKDPTSVPSHWSLLLCVLQAGSDGVFLSLVMHHIIMDGFSLDIMMRDLLAAYAAFKRKAAPQLAPLSVQYIDFAHWQQEQMDNEAWKPQVGCLSASCTIHPFVSYIDHSTLYVWMLCIPPPVFKR